VKTFAVVYPNGVTAGGLTRAEVRASRFDVVDGVLVFFDINDKPASAFQTWVRIDRVT
jgi:hypothetical protein